MSTEQTCFERCANADSAAYGLCGRGHEAYQRIPDSLLHRVFGGAVKGEIVDDRSDNHAAARKIRGLQNSPRLSAAARADHAVGKVPHMNSHPHSHDAWGRTGSAR